MDLRAYSANWQKINGGGWFPPSKVQRIEDETMSDHGEEALVQAGKKRRGSLATSSSGISSMGLGMRTMVREEVQGMMAKNLLAPISFK